VVTLETALPPLNVVTVTLETCGFLGAALRVLVLRGALGAVAVDLGAVAVLGINALRVYSFIIKEKGVDKRQPLQNLNELKQKGPVC